MTTALVQLVPQADTPSCSLGMFAAMIVQPLQEMFQCSCAVVGSRISEHPTSKLFRCSERDDLVFRIESAVGQLEHLGGNSPIILLHYVGYGYQSRGAPLWLLSDMKRLKKLGYEVWIFFHELFASTAKPWKSAFFFSVPQIFICRELARIGDRIFTTTNRYRKILRKISGRNADLVSVCPNISAPRAEIAVEARHREKVVVFGRAATRQRLYSRSRAHLRNLQAAIPGLSWIDIGPALRSREYPPELNLEIKGFMNPAKLSACLLESKLGAIQYPCDLLGKSGIVSTLKAHGVAVVCFCDHGDSHVHIPEPGVLYYTERFCSLSPSEKESILLRSANIGLEDYLRRQTPEKCAAQIVRAHIGLISTLKETPKKNADCQH